MLPVVAHLITVEQARMASNDCILGRNFEPVRIKRDGHLLVSSMAGDGITVALHRDRTCT